MKTLQVLLTKQDKLLILKLAVLMITITTLPYLYGYMTTPSNSFFNGLHSLTTGDLPVYYSYIEQVKSGSKVLYNFFSFEQQRSGLFNIFWISTGSLARLFHLSSIWTIQLLRILLILPAVYTTYIFTYFIFQKYEHRRLAMIFILFSAGIGTYIIPIITATVPDFYVTTQWPIDYWIPESITFLTLYHLPHVVCSLTLMLLMYMFYLYGFFNSQYKYAVYSGLTGLILFNFHPYHVVSIYLILGVYTLLYYALYSRNKTHIYFTAIIIFISIASPLYHVFTIFSDPIIRARASQNITITPPLLHVFSGYGFLMLGTVYTWYQWYQKQKINPLQLFLTIWILISFILIYSPFNFQSRFLQGLHIPLSVLTTYGIVHIFKNYQIRFLRSTISQLLIFTLIFGMTPFVHIVRDIIYYHDNFELFYTQNSHYNAYTWIKNNTTKDDVILSNYTQEDIRLSLFLTGYTNTKTYISHMHETVFYKDKNQQIQDLIESGSLDAWEYFFQDNNIKYIIKNHQTALMYPETILENVFENESITIFKTPLTFPQE